MEWLKRAWLGKNSSVDGAKQGKMELNKVAWPDDDDKLLIVFENISVGAGLLARDGQFLKVNQSFCEMLGYTPQELMKIGIQDIAHPEDRGELSNLSQVFFQRDDHDQFEKRYIHKLGYTMWVSAVISQIHTSYGRNQYFISQLRDITKYKQMEEDLRQTRNLLHGIIEGTPDVFFMKDKEGRFLVINPAGASLFGRKAEEIIGRNDAELHSPEYVSQISEIDRQVLNTGEAKTYELAITASGVMKAFLFTKTPYRDHTGQIIGLVGIGRDITEHQRSAEHLENSRAELRALSARLQSVREEERMRIAREIHDELGQVLTGLKIDVVSLARKISDPDTKVDWGQLRTKTESIASLINNAILTVRKISTELRPGLLDAVGLIAAIEWQAREFEKRTGIKCRLKLPSASISLDQNRSIAVFRIFQEILTNVARHSQATEVAVIIEEQNASLLLEARDNGRGIRASEFSNPKSLGLLGMRERALLLGGEVNIRGVQGKGTTVSLRVPFESNDSDDYSSQEPQNNDR